jgi:hypothetical protein
MYLIRRVAKVQSGKAREVAGHLSKICKAYEGAGRNPATVYFGGMGVPGSHDMVYADWTQETIAPTDMATVPESVGVDHGVMAPMLIDYTLELYELVE